MAAVGFDAAVARVLESEGYYSNDPRDAGGETKYGISKRAYPSVDIASLTLDGAKAIYRRDYWDALRCDELPPRIAFALFDSAVNSGRGPALKWLQQALNVAADGAIGPVTIQAAKQAAGDVEGVLMRFYGYRLRMLTDLATWPSFSRGWVRRVARDLIGG